MARKHALDAAMADTSRQLKVARQHARDAKRGEAHAWRLSEPLRNTLLFIYVLAGYVTAPAAAFLAAAGRKRHWPAMTEAELERRVEDLFVGVDEHERAALTDMDGPTDTESMRMAPRCTEEWRVAGWATRLNFEQGVASPHRGRVATIGDAAYAAPSSGTA